MSRITLKQEVSWCSYICFSKNVLWQGHASPVYKLCFVLLVPRRLRFTVTQSDLPIGTFEISCCPLVAGLGKRRAGIEKPPCSPVLPPPPPLSCMVQYDRQMCENAAHHSARLGAAQERFSEWEISGWSKDSQFVMFLKDGLQWYCFYHTQDFFFVIKGAGAGQAEVGEEGVSSYTASRHMSHFPFLVWTITLSFIFWILLFISPERWWPWRPCWIRRYFISPRYRNRTQRYCVMTPSFTLCFVNRTVCSWPLTSLLQLHHNSSISTFQNRFVMCNQLNSWTLIFFSFVFVWQILFCTVKLFWQHIGLL